jgi:surface antigen
MTKYVARTTCPETTNKYYASSTYCPFVASGYGMFQIGGNCTSYSYSRFAELLDKKPNGLPTSNAENWYQDVTNFDKGQTPKLGAIVCWKQGTVHKSTDGAGHVAVVEKINTDKSILISESGQNGKNSFLFRTRTLTYPYKLSGYQLEGFIYNGIDYESDTTSTVNVQYQTYDNTSKKWWDIITNYNTSSSNGFAGYSGHQIGGVRVKLSSGGKITVKSHLKGGNWLSEVTKWDNTSNGYSGVLGKPIDLIMVKAENVNIKYRVHILGGDWLSWVTGYNQNDAKNGYAGIIGKEIDLIQIGVN